MEVRPADHDDTEAIRSVARAAWETDYPDIVSRETVPEAIEEWYGPDQVQTAIDDEATVVLVADEDGSVVGFSHAAVATGSRTGAILRTYVHPDHRRAGVGSRLLGATVDGLREKQCDRIEAMVLADNELGNEFYRSAGFERIDTNETRIAGEPYDEHRYVYRQE